MSRLHRVLAVLTAAALVVAMAGCTTANGNGVAASGTTSADLVTVSAPRILAPVLDVKSGIAKAQTPGRPAGGAALSAASAAYSGPSVAGRLTTVTVRAGDTVRKGQVIAVFDDRLLQLDLKFAKAGYRRAVKGADTLVATASDLRDQRADVRSLGLAGLAKGKAQLSSGQSQLEKGIDGLGKGIRLEQAMAALSRALPGAQAAYDAAVARLAALQKLAAGPTPPADIQKQIAAAQAAVGKAAAGLGQTKGQLAGMQAALKAANKAGLPPLPKALAQLARLKATLAKLRTQGPQQLAAGRAKLYDGLAKMSDGIDQLKNGARVSRVASGMKGTAVKAAQDALAKTTLRAPCDGVVVSALPAGQLAMVGAPVVVIRPAGVTNVDVYLAPEDLGAVKAGDAADVTLDSIPGVLHGTVSTVWPNQTFPPTNYPTKVVHMSLVTRVTVRIANDALPRGIPCDVVIHPSR